MSNLGGPLSATTLASGSSAGYTSSPGSSGRLSRFSSLGFDPRSSLGSIDSSRSSVSGQHIHAAGAGWWNKDDKARDLSHAGPSSIGRQPSFSRFAFDSERKMETGEGEGIRRASDQIPARTSGLMDGDPLTRYSRFESYPFDSRPAPAIPWHSALPGRRDSSFAAPSTATNSRLSSNATETVAARPYLRSALSAVDPYSEPLITSRPDTSRRLTSPGSDLGMQSRSASDQTTTPALIGSIANAAAIANERERQERRVSLAFGGGKTARGGSAGMPDRNYAGPTHGPYAEEGGGRYASLPSRSYLRPETDDTARLSDAESEPRRVSRTGSFTDIAAERQYAAGEEMRRPSSGPASPVRSHRSEKHLGPRAERPYRPRMQSMMDSSGSITSSSASGSAGPSIFGDYQGRHLPNAFRRDSVIPPDGFRRDSTIPPDGFRRDSAIPPEGFSPVGRGHEDRARRANNLEEPTYPSVLRQEPPRQSISGPSVQSNIPFRSSPRGPMTSQQPTDLAAPTAYMITPIYAHDGGGGPLPASFSPAYATAGTNVPSGSAMRLVTGPPLQADLPSPYSTGPLAMPGSRPGTAFEDSRRENVSGSGPKYTCVHCAKSFNRPSSLKIHIYSHTGEKPVSVLASLPNNPKLTLIHMDPLFSTNAIGQVAPAPSPSNRTSKDTPRSTPIPSRFMNTTLAIPKMCHPILVTAHLMLPAHGEVLSCLDNLERMLRRKRRMSWRMTRILIWMSRKVREHELAVVVVDEAE